MSKDMLTPTIRASAPESPMVADPRPTASSLVSDLLAGLKREWKDARPESESLWQLAGE